MILAIDVAYHGAGARVAGVCFESWTDESESAAYVTEVSAVADYVAGEFYKRELPCMLELITEHALAPDCIVIDGYVFLDGETRPGLGKHLFDALGGEIPVVGVAKNPFRDIPERYELLRGESGKPLYVTAIGMSHEQAMDRIGSMHGAFRIPTLLKLADTLSRA